MAPKKSLRNKVKFYSGLSLIVFFMVFYFSNNSSQANGAPVKRITLVIGDYMPYTSTSIKGNGLLSEIVALACREGNIDYELKFYPWARCSNMVKSGEAWATFPYVYTTERAAEFNYSDKLIPDSTMIFYMKNNKRINLKGLNPKNLSTFKNYKFAGIVGYNYEKLFKDAKLDVDWSYGENDIIHKLINGRVDFVAQNNIVGIEAFKQLYPKEFNNVAMFKEPMLQNYFYLMASKKYNKTNELLIKFNTGLKKASQNGGIDKIMKKYGISLKK